MSLLRHRRRRLRRRVRRTRIPNTDGGTTQLAQISSGTAIAARDIFTAAATALGIQLANLTRLVDSETIALGGGVTLAGDIFWDPLHATMEESLAQDSIPIPDWSKPSSAATPASTAQQ